MVAYLSVFLITITLVVALRPVAANWGLLDHPGGRKNHEGVVPVIGGIAIFGGICIGAFLLSSSNSSALLTVFGIAAVLVLIGFLDDARGLSPLEKFGAQIIAAFLMATVARVKIENLGFLISHDISLSGGWSIAVTIIGVVGLVNAVNMIDGMDGLAGGVVAVALSFFAFAAYIGDSSIVFQLALLTLFAVLGFLIFNVRIPGRPSKIFMGDAGSMLLGFILAWLAVSLSQGTHRDVTPIAAVWVVGVPLLDALTMMLQRILSGKSPFAADRGHMHHILLDHGLSVNQTLLVIMAVSALFGVIGLGSYYLAIPERWMLAAAVLVFAIYFVVTLFVKRELKQDLQEARLFEISDELQISGKLQEQQSRAA